MIFRKINSLLLTLLVASSASVAAQTTPEEVMGDLNKSGGVYYAYPIKEAISTPAPKGYKPVHISHYGRHGSRYLISDNDYTRISDMLHKADSVGALTALGVDVMHRLDLLMVEARGRGGDLSPLGVRQHKAIAKRMYDNYPDVFKGNAKVSARSTTVVRCVLSMDAFCESLKEQNPKLDITRESSNRYMPYLNYHSKESMNYTSGNWRVEYDKFEKEHVHPDRLMKELFSDQNYVRKNIRPDELMWGLYWLASDSQDVETKVDFYDLFTPQELFDLWQCVNYRFYVCDGNYPGNGGLLVDNAKPLLRNVVMTADEALNGYGPAAALRFGHDGNLIPYAALLKLDGCYGQAENPEDFYKVFSDFKVAPMAGNVQIIFFNKPGAKPEDAIVKFLHNEKETRIPIETDMFPYYKWSDVRRYFIDILNEE